MIDISKVRELQLMVLEFRKLYSFRKSIGVRFEQKRYHVLMKRWRNVDIDQIVKERIFLEYNID